MDDHAPDQSGPASPAEEAPAPSRLNRRSFLKVTSVSGAAAVLAACAAPPAPPPQAAATTAPPAEAPPTAAPPPTAAAAEPTAAAAEPAGVTLASDLLPYPRLKIATLGDLGSGAFSATYPDSGSPVQILKLGAKTAGGVGPDEDIVAYSSLCTHMGCPVSYDAASKIFACPCHYSHFDAAADAMLINGPATQHLPRLALEVDGQDIYAVGVSGLIYGRPHNLSLTEL